MPTINIESTPRTGPSMFDPANSPQDGSVGKSFSLLRTGTTNSSKNLGGRFALPIEFDVRTLAARFAEEGNEMQSSLQDEPVMGTGWVADGWKVWKYPATTGQQKFDEDGDPEVDGKGQPILAEHPQAGKAHRLSSLERNGPVYVLMCRPVEVQNQVNEAYGLLSIDNMAAEARGDTIAGADAKASDQRSMLTSKALSRVEGAEIAADVEYEEKMGRTSVVASTIPANSGRLTKAPLKVRK